MKPLFDSFCLAVKQLCVNATGFAEHLLLVVFVAVMLVGCSTKTKVVVKTQTLYQEVPTELTTPVKPQPPIDKVAYIAMPVYEREVYLANYSVDLLKSLYSCNVQLGAISTLANQWKANPP